MPRIKSIYVEKFSQDGAFGSKTGLTVELNKTDSFQNALDFALKLLNPNEPLPNNSNDFSEKPIDLDIPF